MTMTLGTWAQKARKNPFQAVPAMKFVQTPRLITWNPISRSIQAQRRKRRNPLPKIKAIATPALGSALAAGLGVGIERTALTPGWKLALKGGVALGSVCCPRGLGYAGFGGAAFYGLFSTLYADYVQRGILADVALALGGSSSAP